MDRGLEGAETTYFKAFESKHSIDEKSEVPSIFEDEAVED
jgi:hypothetical protein